MKFLLKQNTLKMENTERPFMDFKKHIKEKNSKIISCQSGLGRSQIPSEQQNDQPVAGRGS